MSILFILVPLSLGLAFAGWGFFWAVGNGQFDDLESPGWDVLQPDSEAKPSSPTVAPASEIHD